MDALEILKDVVVYGSFVIAGAVVALNGIAPLTKTTKDDGLRDKLVWFHDKVLALLLPFVTVVKKDDEPKE